MNLTSQVVHVFRKELRIEWQQRMRISGVFWFSLAVVLMVAFATPESALLPRIAGGTLWVGLLLASTRSLDQSYAIEHEHDALEGLLLWPVDPVAIYYGKALSNAFLLTLVASGLFPLLIAVFDVSIRGDVTQAGLAVLLGCAALAAPGTLYGLITSQARGSSVLLPLLQFPLVVPAVLAAANATAKVFEGDPMGQAPAWLAILAVFNVVHWSLGGLVYGRILES